MTMAGAGPAFSSWTALEILRETVRILRRNSSPFLAALLFLLCPISAALLSSVFVAKPARRALFRRALLFASSSGLPPSHFLKQVCSYLVETVLSTASCYPLLITFLLIAKASVAYSIACIYASKEVETSDFLALLRSIWKRLVWTYLCASAAIFATLVLFVTILVMLCSSLAAIGYPAEVIVYPALFVTLAFSIVYAHLAVLCNLAGVVSLLEEKSGVAALLRSISLVEGHMRVGLCLFLGSTIGMAFVEGLFEHRVKTLSYGDGSSRIWEGPLLVLMHGFALLVDSMMSAVFYFSCRSSSLEEFDGSGDLSEEMTILTSAADVL